MKADIEIDIPALDSFTVVLKMIGGIDKRFFKSFNFGWDILSPPYIIYNL